MSFEASASQLSVHEQQGTLLVYQLEGFSARFLAGMGVPLPVMCCFPLISAWAMETSVATDIQP